VVSEVARRKKRGAVAVAIASIIANTAAAVGVVEAAVVSGFVGNNAETRDLI
jgi:hypothetical protein